MFRPFSKVSRRDWLRNAGTGAATLAASRILAHARPLPATRLLDPAGLTAVQNQDPGEPAAVVANRAQRMQWWHAARFGMFIHWGLYSVLGRHEWAMEDEGIPVREYERLADRFQPVPHAARAWARLARQAGQKYMVMTTKHHEGFCHFDTRYTDYCATKRGPRRDLVREFVEAARGEGLRVGFYYSLMDWHHPDGARCATDEAARRRFVAYTHGVVRELMTNYGKIDVLWYDVDWPLSPEQWESAKLNEMVFQLQPEIIVNNRNGLPGDFSTPEQHIAAAKGGRAWETCMTMNDSWGFQRADDDWKSGKTIVRDLVTCARDCGNYLLNIGPEGDGSIPEPSVARLTQVGPWLARNGAAIYESEPCRVQRSVFAGFTRRGHTLYAHVHFWPGSAFGIGGLRTKVLAARLLDGGRPLRFTQDDFRVQLTGLPHQAPDAPVTVLELECAGEPVQDMNYVRTERPRDGVYTYDASLETL